MVTARTLDAFAESLAAELRRAAAECPQRPFIRIASGERSYAQIDAMSDRVAVGLHAQGVRRSASATARLKRMLTSELQNQLAGALELEKQAAMACLADADTAQRIASFAAKRL